VTVQTEQIEIIIGEGTLGKKSAFGHMAILINDIVYTQGPEGYKIYSHENYIRNQSYFKNSFGFILRVTADEKRIIETEIKRHFNLNTNYNELFNNCTTAIVNALDKASIIAHDPRFIFFTASPREFMTVIQRSDRFVTKKFYSKHY
jgi:hypothetical protein